jgi:hypothetical protein
VYACKVDAHEVHAHEVHAHKVYTHEVADDYEVCAYTVYTLGAYLIGVHLMGVHFTGVHLMWNPPQESHNREWQCGCAVVEVGGPEPTRTESQLKTKEPTRLIHTPPVAG